MADICSFTIMSYKMKSSWLILISTAGYITMTCTHARVEYSLEQVDYII